MSRYLVNDILDRTLVDEESHSPSRLTQRHSSRHSV